MAKKDFSNIQTSSIYQEIEDATAGTRKQRRTYTDTEALEAMQEMQTSGRKGVKLPRINMAFTPDNYTF